MKYFWDLCVAIFFTPHGKVTISRLTPQGRQMFPISFKWTAAAGPTVTVSPLYINSDTMV